MKRSWPARLWPALVWPALLGLALVPGLLSGLLGRLDLGELPARFDPPLWRMLLSHLGLVALSSLLIVAVGWPLAALITRPGRADLRELVETLVGFGQTVPTLAILALAVPVLGFGWKPTLLGLLLYGLLPVLGNAVVGFMGVDRGALDAAQGMGMTPWQRLTRVEFPLALPVLLAGVRTATVFNVGTATIGAALGAGGLGQLIINGLSEQNTALVLLGAILCALLALSLDGLLRLLVPEKRV